jgi:hypothetical protein
MFAAVPRRFRHRIAIDHDSQKTLLLRSLRSFPLAAALAALVAACRAAPETGELHAQQVILEREVDGLRQLAARLERGEPALAPEDVVVGISDTMVQEILSAQLPLEARPDQYVVVLNQAEVAFKGSPGVMLHGTIALRDRPSLAGELKAIGVLSDIKIDPASGTLRARVSIDHIDLLKVAGLESFLSGGTVDELARTLRAQLAGQIPEIQIPVSVEQRVDLPTLADGPVRLQGATFPLAASVSDVFAGQGQLWIGIKVELGEPVRTGAEP